MTNLAAVYGVTVQAATGSPVWRATSVRRLTGKENGSKRNVFVKVLQPNGDRDRNSALRIGWTWDGRRPGEQAPPAQLDKPDHGELGHGNVPIDKWQKVAVWIEGDDIDSDVVAGMHTNFPDDEPGNTWGHFSYEVIFQRTNAVTIDPPVVDPPTTTPDFAADIAQLRATIVAMQQQLAEQSAILDAMQGEL